jgi:hypothetical protein
VHGLQLAAPVAERLQRPDAEQLTAGAPVAEERDRRVRQPLDAERERVLGRRLPGRERQVPLQQRDHVRLARVVDGDAATRAVVTICHGLDHTSRMLPGHFGQVLPH